MSPVFDSRDETQLLPGLRQARQAIARGELIVLPTDTVYGVAADAFSPAAVARLLAAKGRGRQSPPPVLVPGVSTLRALAAEIPEPVERLVEEQIPLTTCPLSNVRLHVVESLSVHPLHRMLDAGLAVTINSDDPAYFGGYVDDVFAALHDELGLTEEERKLLARNSIRAAFT